MMSEKAPLFGDPGTAAQVRQAPHPGAAKRLGRQVTGFDELERARNFIAHNRMLSAAEFARLEMYVGDWNRQVGL